MITAQIPVYAQVYTDPDTVRAVQAKLIESGFDCGSIDGVAGMKTIIAARGYQEAHGLEVTGQIDDTLLISMDLLTALDDPADSSPTVLSADSSVEPAAVSSGSDSESFISPEADSPLESSAESLPEPTEPPVTVPPEALSIDGTVIYNDHDVAVTAELSGDKDSVIYRIQNHSDLPVLAVTGELIVNGVTIHCPLLHASDFVWYMPQILPDFADQASFEDASDSCYVEAGETDSFRLALGTSLKDVFGYDEIFEVRTSVGIVGLSKELRFNRIESFYEEHMPFTDDGDTVTVLKTEAAASASAKLPDKGLLFDYKNVRLYDLGVQSVSDGYIRIGLLLENHSRLPLSLDCVPDDRVLVNGKLADEAYGQLLALPHTLSYGTLSVAAVKDVEIPGDIANIYVPLLLEDLSHGSTYTLLAYSDGADADEQAAQAQTDAFQSVMETLKSAINRS
ncbi:MAG: peptidoglycan-binding domain-containing protein [Lachnospiraceae bacterium]|nr:peptidoglycan-binding domain-containing protein [Lachnospiraceae bacterium]